MSRGSAAALHELGVLDAAAAIRARGLTSTALVEACLARIEATDADVLAWVTIDADGALAAARALDRELADGRRRGPLHGIPIGLKDIIDAAGLVTTAGAAAFAHRRPTSDSTVVARLRAAGAVILGKVVATPFAYKDPAPTRNPWSADHTPGGSSSGSAAAVASRQVPAAIGTQTIGSILRPAAFCGVVGLKGEFGRVPLDGIVPLAPSFDHVGPLARSVADAALVEAVLEGREPAPPRGRRPPRLAVGRRLLDRAEPALRAHLEATVDRLAAAGAEIVEVEVPASVAELVDAAFPRFEAEVAAVHRGAFASHEAEFPPHIAGVIRAGLGRSSADLDEADRAIERAAADAAPVLGGADALLTPVAPGPAPRRVGGTGDFTLCGPWSFLGVPALSLPTGVDADGLPLANQVVAGRGGLPALLAAAVWAEGVLGFEAAPPEPPGR